MICLRRRKTRIRSERLISSDLPRSPASAAPRPLAAPGDTGDDGEGGSKSLNDKLDDASKGYVQAKAKLAASKKSQLALTAQLKTIDAQLAPQQAAFARPSSRA